VHTAQNELTYERPAQPILLRLEPLAVLCAALSIAWFTFDPRVQQARLEGDELVHVVLTDQLARGTYTLRGTPVPTLPGFSRYLYDRAVHYNPPLYDAILLGVRASLGPTRYVYVSILASALCACLVYRLTRRRASPLSAAFAMLVFLGCPIVYLVSCKIWAEASLALLVCLIAECCERKRLGPAGLAGLGVLLAAAALVKASVLFVLPGLCLLVLRDRWRLSVLISVPVLVTALWLGYVLYANAASPPAVMPPDDRFDNAFVAAQASKPALSLFYLPFVLNPGYALGLLAFRRERAREYAAYALCVLGCMLAFSMLAWMHVGTYHTKYIGCVTPFLALLAGAGFEHVAQHVSARRRALVRAALLLAVAFALIVENAINRRTWIAEVDPSLYLARAQSAPRGQLSVAQWLDIDLGRRAECLGRAFEVER
jgi:4-amino-4-deoxy-L-arabinose transferase-like glycosyltransferase